MKRTVKLLATVALMVAPSSVSAASITTLRSTGIDAAGNLIPDTAVDPNYVLTQVPLGSGYGPDAFIVDSNKRPLNLPPSDPTGWLSNDSLSKWIAPAADQSTFPDSTGSGTYVYRTTFDQTGLVASTARIEGRWLVDNTGLDIIINGQSTGIQQLTGFRSFSSFVIDDGFVSGINMLDFVVFNAPLPTGTINPSGLRVEMVGTAVPEPSAFVLVASAGIVGLFSLRRCRN